MFRLTRVKAVSISIALTCMFAASACGSDDSSGSADSPGSSGSSGSQAGSDSAGGSAATDALAPFLEKSEDIGITEPLSGTPPTGKVVYAINVQSPLTTEQVDGMTAAADALGWTVKPLYWTTNPADADAQIKQAVQAKADFIAVNGVPDAVLQDGIEAAKAANIPIFFLASSTDPQGDANWHFSNVNGVKRFAEAGAIAANYVTANSGGDAHVLNVDIDGFDVQAAQTKGFEGELKTNCPGCDYAHLAISVADLGTPGKVSSAVVEYLRSNPGVDWIVFGAGSMTIGMPEAAAAAGLTDLNVMSINGILSNVAAVNKGDEVATVSEGLPYLGWLVVDAMARQSLGMDLTPNWNVTIPELVQTKDNIEGDDDEFTGPTNYEESFKALWNVS